MKSHYEMLVSKLNAAHAVITEVQSLLRLMHENGLMSFKDEVAPAVTDVAESTVAKDDGAHMGDGKCRLSATTDVKMTQGDLFEAFQKVAKSPSEVKSVVTTCAGDGDKVSKKTKASSGKKTDVVRHRGEPAVSRSMAMRNYREIVKGREVIHLADVNRIFGYSGTTSGNFVKTAIRDGKLKTIEYGNLGKKFLSRDVLEFVSAYFNGADARTK